MHISSSLWSSGAVRSASARASSLDADGSWPAANYKQHKLNKCKKQEEAQHTQPFRGPTAPKVSFYASTDARNIDEWLAEVKRRKEVKPTAEQFAILKGVTRRIKYEMRREQAAESLPQPDDEPMLDLIHGLPGTGKSEVIAWPVSYTHLTLPTKRIV